MDKHMVLKTVWFWNLLLLLWNLLLLFWTILLLLWFIPTDWLGEESRRWLECVSLIVLNTRKYFLKLRTAEEWILFCVSSYTIFPCGCWYFVKCVLIRLKKVIVPVGNNLTLIIWGQVVSNENGPSGIGKLVLVVYDQ